MARGGTELRPEAPLWVFVQLLAMITSHGNIGQDENLQHAWRTLVGMDFANTVRSNCGRPSLDPMPVRVLSASCRSTILQRYSLYTSEWARELLKLGHLSQQQTIRLFFNLLELEYRCLGLHPDAVIYLRQKKLHDGRGMLTWRRCVSRCGRRERVGITDNTEANFDPRHDWLVWS
jgi:hypothetical protein